MTRVVTRGFPATHFTDLYDRPLVGMRGSACRYEPADIVQDCVFDNTLSVSKKNKAIYEADHSKLDSYTAEVATNKPAKKKRNSLRRLSNATSSLRRLSNATVRASVTNSSHDER